MIELGQEVSSRFVPSHGLDIGCFFFVYLPIVVITLGGDELTSRLAKKGPKFGTFPVFEIPILGDLSNRLSWADSLTASDVVVSETIIQTGAGKARYAASLFHITSCS